MTHQATELLAGWIAENVRAVPAEERENEAARLATEFVAYAKDAGLGGAELKELEEDISEKLVDYMEDALEAAGVAANDNESGGAV